MFHRFYTIGNRCYTDLHSCLCILMRPYFFLFWWAGCAQWRLPAVLRRPGNKTRPWKIWPWILQQMWTLAPPRSGPRAQKDMKMQMKIIWNGNQNHVEVRDHMIFIFISYHLYVNFTFWGPTPWPRLQSGGKGLRPCPARRRFGAPKCENNMKIMWNKYENNAIAHFHIIFTFTSHHVHMIFTSLGSGPRSGFPKSCCFIFQVILFHILLIFCQNLVFQFFHTDSLYNASICYSFPWNEK